MRSLTLILWLAAAGTVLAADLPPLDEFTATMPQPAHLWVSPDGHGHDLQHAYGPGWGGQVDGTIEVQLLDDNLDPIVGYPREDIWLADVQGDFVFCAAANIADHDTDLDGRTTISGPFRAGGQIMPDGEARVYVAGSPIGDAPLPLTINSPDVNGDLRVNLADIAPFVQALQSGYDWRFDFNADGTVNLVDISIFVATLGEECP
ncbi:MAG: hypothetical protein R3D98_03965 [Candidatus Krumholzibacteriia bacterium]